MPLPTLFSLPSGDRTLAELELPLDPSALLPGASGPWEVELGFGKGRYLLRRAQEDPGRRFLGVEIVSKYQRMLARRARRRELGNLATIRGEALQLLATVLPRGFADRVHVYFPDPWPKSRHHKRRLFDPETIDLVVGLLRPGGELQFATDHPEYGDEVVGVLRGTPGFSFEIHDGPWPEGARTNWEAKFEAEGLPILRLTGRLEGAAEPHPAGRNGLLVAYRPPAREVASAESPPPEESRSLETDLSPGGD